MMYDVHKQPFQPGALTKYHIDTGTLTPIVDLASRPAPAVSWRLILFAFIMMVRVTSEVPWAQLIILHKLFSEFILWYFFSPQTSLNRISTFAVTAINYGYYRDASVIILKTFGVPAVCQILNFTFVLITPNWGIVGKEIKVQRG